MKKLKKIVGCAGLAFAAMMLTSCKAKIGGGEFSILWQILAIIMWFIALCEMEYLLPKKEGALRRICGYFNLLLFVCGVVFPFVWAPLPYIPKISLGAAAFFWIISLIRGAPIKAQKEAEEKERLAAKAKAEEEEKEAARKAEAEAKAKAEAEAKAAAEAKAKAEAEAKAAAEAKAKAEAEAKAKAEAEEKAKKLSEAQASLSQKESDLEAKKAEVASLGLDAQGIVRKAALNKEIKELEPEIEALKAEIERLSK